MNTTVLASVAVIAVAFGYAAPVAWADGARVVRGRCAFVGEHVTVAAGHIVDCPHLSVVAGNVIMESGATNRGDVQVVAGDALVDGVVEGRLLVLGGNLALAEDARVVGDVLTTGQADIRGVVEGGVTAFGDVELGPRSAVARVSTLARVGQADGAVVRDLSASGQGGGAIAVLALAAFFTLLSALFAALLVRLAPAPVHRVRDAAARAPLLSCLAGALAWGLALLAMLPLVFTIVGPAILVALLLAGSLLGWVAFSLAVGMGLRLGPSGARSAAVGGALLALIGMLLVGGGSLLGGRLQGPAVCTGLLFLAVLWTWGLGASLLTLFGTRPWPRRPQAPMGAAEGAGAPVDETAALEQDQGAGRLQDTDMAAAPFEDSAESVAAPVGEVDGAVLAAAEPSVLAGGDVRELPGISPIYALLLREAGLGTVGQLAAASLDRVRAAVAVPGVAPVEDAVLAGWIQVAQRLAPGA
jgi:cytoskeletal protein CcmA (bactofilin family)/predicted flap endonuclease-1-like 5' DNA nuclease